MGKIPVYSSNQLASSIVGIPSQDQSGQMIAQAVGQLAQTTASIVGHFQEKADTLEASVTAKGPLVHAYEQKRMEVAKRFVDDPTLDYKTMPQVMQEEGAKLVDSLGKNLKGGAATKFRELGTKYVESDIPNNYDLVAKRQTQIITGQALQGYHDIAFQAGQIKDPIQFQVFMDGGETKDAAGNLVRQPGALEKHSQNVNTFFKPESIIALENQARTQATKQHLYTRLEDNPYSLYQDIEAGKYDKIFTDGGEKKQWEDKVLAYRKTMDDRTNLRTALSGSGELIGMLPKIDSGEISLNQLEFSRDYAIQNKGKVLNGNPNTKMVPDWYLPSVENLIEYAIKQPPAPEHTQQAEELKARWIEHLNAPNETDGAPGTIQDHEQVMSIYSDATRLLKEGKITKAEFQQLANQMETQITSKVNGGQVTSSRLSEVVTDAKYPFHVAGDNVFDIGVRVIHDGIEGNWLGQGGRPFPNETVKRQAYLDAITTLTSRIKSDDTLQAQFKNMTRTERVQAMKLIVWGVKDPRTGKVVKPGIIDRMGLISDNGQVDMKQPLTLGARKIVGGIPMIVGAIGINGEAVWIPENKQSEKAFGGK